MPYEEIDRISEPHHEKTMSLQMRKRMCRSAARLQINAFVFAEWII